MNFKKEQEERAAQIEVLLQSYLPEEKGYAKTVIEAMNYSVMAGGKRLRPMLMQETFRLFGGTGKAIEPFMAALEMIHTYSLVHDDLPAMDNDEYRRGRKTTHVVYGEGMAILAGDALLNYAFELATRAFQIEPDNGNISKAFTVLAEKAGIFGMIGGQVADIEGEDMGNQVTKEQLLYIHAHKTAALIQSAMMIGAILAGAGEREIAAVEKIGYNVGIAFQIQDDILDITSSLEVLGKPVGSDEKNHKTTYVTLEGVEKSKEEVRQLSEEAIALLDSFNNRNEFLDALLRALITREK